MEMIAVKGARKNLLAIGWQTFTLLAEFRGGRRYEYGGVPEEVKTKLLNSPYPDSLFQKIVRGKYVSKRVDLPPAVPMPRTEIDYDSIPF